MRLTHARLLVDDFAGCFRFWGIRVAHFRDPAGNLVEVNRPL